MYKPLVAVACLALVGCSASRVTSSGGGQIALVRQIAMMPGGGLMADAVAVELGAKGFRIIDAATTSSMMARLNLNELEISRPEGLGRLKAQGIDALLSVRGAAGEDGEPQSASARLTSTESGAMMAGVTWQNARAGVSGSIADRVIKKGLSEAAAQIASELAAKIRQ